MVLAIVGSVLAGTLANYTVALDDVASGSVVGKEFIFMEDGTDTFQHDIKIAPTETVVWQFGVRNYNENLITETNLDYDLTFDVHATPGKSAINPLVVTIKDANGTVVASQAGTGVMEVKGSFPLSDIGQSAAYSVEIHWPGNDEVDMNYAGSQFGTTVNVSAVAKQVAVCQNETNPNPDPAQSNVAVKYEAGQVWAEGGTWDADAGALVGQTYKHKFRVTITNNSETAVQQWQLKFLFPEQIYQYWDAQMVSSDAGTGSYMFECPNDYNKVIPPGASITLGGLAVGKGDQPVTSVSVKDGVSGNNITAAVENVYRVNLP